MLTKMKTIWAKAKAYVKQRLKELSLWFKLMSKPRKQEQKETPTSSQGLLDLLNDELAKLLIEAGVEPTNESDILLS